MTEPLAHSARDGASEQTYRAHVSEVTRLALEFGRAAMAFSPKWRESFLASLEMAATYHDLGKLDAIFQDDLRRNRRRTGLNHVDAGTAHLLKSRHAEAAVAVYAHHIGLPSFPTERAKNANGVAGMFRDLDGDVVATGLKTHQRTDQNLAEYMAGHARLLWSPHRQTQPFRRGQGLVRRLLLSCLVDGDHSDTARHYANEHPVAPPKLRAAERLEALDRFVAGLAADAKPQTEMERLRQELREQVYRACRGRPVEQSENTLSCDSPVGTGKTTAVMAYLLRVAAERGLRRVFVVLPFTNIIDQSVDVYRRAIRLPDETEMDMEAAVAAHHHRVDYESFELRHLAARWDSPIVVTTAVQFFETLAAKEPSSLRKLHQVAGSGIFVDEAHAALPPSLWPQMFRWLRELCDDWSCHLVLASGSLARFWELTDFVPLSERRTIPELVAPEVANRTKDFEGKRINIRSKSEKYSLPKLAEFVLGEPGPRLVILNTVQSAAVFANYLRDDCKLGLNVEHISTALTPQDRTKTVRRVREHLASSRKDWCLVATSCVEAGVDFSFRSAFRESWGLVNLLQIAGRANRSGEYPGTEVWDFHHDESAGFCLHPQADIARNILAELFVRCEREGRQPGPEDCTEALRLELRNDRGIQALRIEEVRRAEEVADYPAVADLCRVISTSTQTVLANSELIRRVEQATRIEMPSWREIMLGSVQIWSNRLRDVPTRQVGYHKGILALRGEDCYDDFIGWMKCMMPQIQAGKVGGAFFG